MIKLVKEIKEVKARGEDGCIRNGWIFKEKCEKIQNGKWESNDSIRKMI